MNFKNFLKFSLLEVIKIFTIYLSQTIPILLVTSDVLCKCSKCLMMYILFAFKAQLLSWRLKTEILAEKPTTKLMLSAFAAKSIQESG